MPKCVFVRKEAGGWGRRSLKALTPQPPKSAGSHLGPLATHHITWRTSCPKGPLYPSVVCDESKDKESKERAENSKFPKVKSYPNPKATFVLTPQQNGKRGRRRSLNGGSNKMVEGFRRKPGGKVGSRTCDTRTCTKEDVEVSNDGKSTRKGVWKDLRRTGRKRRTSQKRFICSEAHQGGRRSRYMNERGKKGENTCNKNNVLRGPKITPRKGVAQKT